jgi:hypothetical protein
LPRLRIRLLRSVNGQLAVADCVHSHRSAAVFEAETGGHRLRMLLLGRLLGMSSTWLAGCGG